MRSITVIIVICIIGCTRTPSNKLFDANDATYRRLLGAGYSSIDRRVTSDAASPCVTSREPNPVLFHAAPSALIKTTFSRDYEYHSEEFNLGVKAGAGIAIKAEFLNAMRDSSLSIAMITDFDYDYGTIALARPQLSMFADRQKDDGDRQRNCGDQYIDQIDLGASFMTALVFNFKEQHESMKLSIKVILELLFTSVDLLSVGAELAKHNIETSVDLKVIQVGGDQNRFAEQLKTLNMDSCGSVEKVSAEEANYRPKLQECLTKYNEALEYAKKDFLSQLQKATSAAPSLSGINGLVAKEVRSRRYDESGFWWFQSEGTEANAALTINKKMDALHKLSSHYSGALYSLEALERDRKKPTPVFKLDAKQIADLKSSLDCANASMSNITKALDTCSSAKENNEPALCLSAFDHISIYRLPYFKNKPPTQTEFPDLECND